MGQSFLLNQIQFGLWSAKLLLKHSLYVDRYGDVVSVINFSFYCFTGILFTWLNSGLQFFMGELDEEFFPLEG